MPVQAEPKDLTALTAEAPDYTRTAGTGKFQHEKSVYIGPRPRTVMGTANAGYLPSLPVRWPSLLLCC